MVRAYLISFATQQKITLGRETFSRRHPHAWLVWEPGNWMVARSSTQGTMIPDKMAAARPGQGDALCFELATAPGASNVRRVGRAETCEIVINDATVSREHLKLELEKEAWWMTVCSNRGAKCLGSTVPKDTKMQLRRGMKVEIGDVELTFYDAEGFVERLGTVFGRKP